MNTRLEVHVLSERNAFGPRDVNAAGQCETTLREKDGHIGTHPVTVALYEVPEVLQDLPGDLDVRQISDGARWIEEVVSARRIRPGWDHPTHDLTRHGEDRGFV
jgi:hypothetical protein